MFGVSKGTIMSVMTVLVALAVINNVEALKPAKEFINGDKGWF